MHTLLCICTECRWWNLCFGNIIADAFSIFSWEELYIYLLFNGHCIYLSKKKRRKMITWVLWISLIFWLICKTLLCSSFKLDCLVAMKVIGKLSEGKASHVPYRDSKLTRLLQSSLSGHGHVSVSLRCYIYMSILLCCGNSCNF
jgi:hypothetical protein